MADEWLRPDSGASGLQALVARAVTLDAGAFARFRVRQEEQSLDVFVTTPFQTVAMRRIKGAVSRDGAVVRAQALLEALVAHNSPDPTPRTLPLGRPADPSWPGALPPAEGFVLADKVPVAVAQELADKGRRLAKQFSGPLGPPVSLMNQVVLTVSGGAAELSGRAVQPGGQSEAAGEESGGGSPAGAQNVEVPMRVIFTATALGLVPGFSAPASIPRYLRVSAKGRWLRLDAPFGTVYHSSRLSLF